MADRSQKTEKPTPRRLKEARRDGQIARSPDLSAWLGMLIAVYLVRFTVTATVSAARTLLADAANAMTDPDPAKAIHLLGTGLWKGALALAPLTLGMLVVGVAASAGQGGIHISGKSFKPKWDHLNPFKGVKRMFGVRSAWEVTKALLKTAILAVLLYQTITSIVPLTRAGTVVPLDSVLHITGSAMFGFARNAAVAGLLMAAADYVYQFRRMRSSLRMTKQEIKDEYRTSDGDPQVKSAIRSRQLAMRRNRMIREVATADVVLVNPTHVAVALKYEAGRGAPKVVAKGAGAIAARIRAEAEKNRVPMVEDVPLARAIYRVCELGQEIPHELFMAVARILAFVFSLKRRGSAAGMHRRPPAPAAETAALSAVTKRRRGRRRPAAV